MENWGGRCFVWLFLWVTCMTMDLCAALSHVSLPREFDSSVGWEACLGFSVIRDQANCSSCCPMAVSNALSARECVNNHRNILFSAQQIWDCSGPSASATCDKGLHLNSMLEAMGRSGHFNKVLIPDSCSSYNDSWEASSARCVSSHYECGESVSIRVQGYISLAGEVFSGNGEFAALMAMQSLMTEIYVNGPVVGVLSLTKPDFLRFSNIGSREDYIFWPNASLSASPIHIHHCIMIYGWGEDSLTGKKYWLIQNSYGKAWGIGGRAKIIRGLNWLELEWRAVSTPFVSSYCNSTSASSKHCILKNGSSSAVHHTLDDTIKHNYPPNSSMTLTSNYVTRDGVIWFSSAEMSSWDKLWFPYGGFFSNLNIMIFTFTSSFAVGFLLFKCIMYLEMQAPKIPVHYHQQMRRVRFVR